MKLTLFFCDKAENRSDGKMDMHGVFNELYAPGFPARQDHLVLAGVIEWNRDDEGQKPFEIEIRDPDGGKVYTIRGHTDVDARPMTRPPARTCLVLPLENLVFPQAGEYTTCVVIGGDLHNGPSLHLMETQGEQ